MQMEKIEALAALMKENGLTLAELEENGERVLLEKAPPPAVAANIAMPSAAMPADTAAPAPAKQGNTLDAPLVGCVYLAPSPDAAPFVQPGERVKKGQVLCILEAMKVMNDFTAPQDGTVAEVLVENGQLVEYGQPMFRMG